MYDLSVLSLFSSLLLLLLHDYTSTFGILRSVSYIFECSYSRSYSFLFIFISSPFIFISLSILSFFHLTFSFSLSVTVFRSLSTDILFGLVKAASSQRSSLRVIITSATLDDEKLSSTYHTVRTIPYVHTFFFCLIIY